MGNPFIRPEATILKRGLSIDLYSTLTIDGVNVIYYYNFSNAPTIFWYENPKGNLFIEDYGLGSLTNAGSNYVKNILSQYKFIF